MSTNCDSLSPLEGAQIGSNISLAHYTTWRIGGIAEWFAEPGTIEEVIAVINWANQQNLKPTILGAGSNLLFND